MIKLLVRGLVLFIVLRYLLGVFWGTLLFIALIVVPLAAVVTGIYHLGRRSAYHL